MMPDNDMGDPDNVTTETIRKISKAGGNKNNKSVMETMNQTHQALIKDTPVDAEPIS